MAAPGPGAEDPIVGSLDVRLHHGHLLSYPLRPSYRPPDPPSGARLRPTRRIFETRYLRNTGDGHFDPRASGDPRMREAKLRSSEVPPKGVELVGLVDGEAGVLHLAPLRSVQVMRPDMTHLDGALKQQAAEAAAAARPNSGQPVKLQTQFRRRDPASEKAAEAYRRTTWAYHAAQEEADAWRELKVFGPGTSAAEAVLNGLKTAGDPEEDGGAASDAKKKAAAAAAAAKRRMAAEAAGMDDDDYDQDYDDDGDAEEGADGSAKAAKGSGTAQYLRQLANVGGGSSGANGGSATSAAGAAAGAGARPGASGGAGGAAAAAASGGAAGGSAAAAGGGAGAPGGAAAAAAALSAAIATLGLPILVPASANASGLPIYHIPTVNAVPGTPGTGNAGLSTGQLAALPVAAQVEEALRRAAALPFRRILEAASSAQSLPEAVDTCESLGRLVLGSWVLKSEVLYGPHWHIRATTGTGAAGRPGRGAAAGGGGGRATARAAGHPPHLKPAQVARLCAVRDFVLASFAASGGYLDVEAMCAATGAQRRTVVAMCEALGEPVEEFEHLAAAAAALAHGGSVGDAAAVAHAAQRARIVAEAIAKAGGVGGVAGATIANGNAYMRHRASALGGAPGGSAITAEPEEDGPTGTASVEGGSGSAGGAASSTAPVFAPRCLVYRFKQLPQDTEFTDRYPDVAERHRRWWRKREGELATQFETAAGAGAGAGAGGRARAGSSASAASGGKGGGATKKGAAAMDDDDEHADDDDDEEEDEGDDAMSGSGSAAEAAGGGSGSSGDLFGGGAQEDAEGGGDTPTAAPLPPVPRTAAGADIVRRLGEVSNEALRRLCDDMLTRKGVVSLAYFAARLRAQPDVPAVRALLAQVATKAKDPEGAKAAAAGRGLPSGAHTGQLAEALQAHLADYAAQVPGRPHLFIRRSSGAGDETLDRYRRVFVRLLARHGPQRRAEVVNALRIAEGDSTLDISGYYWGRLTKELATGTQGGSWVLRTGGEEAAAAAAAASQAAAATAALST